MFNYPYFLGLFLLVIGFLIWRSRRYYLRHAYLNPLQKANKSKNTNLIQTFCSIVGWIFLVVAASGLTWGFIERRHHQPIHKYVLINDGSGSMVERSRVRGIGKRLSVLIKGNNALLSMLNKRSDGSRDLVGAIVFSDDAFIVSYLVDDPGFVGKKLNMIDYEMFPLCQGTNIEKGIWAGLDMLISGIEEPDSDFDNLGERMYGSGHVYKKDETIVNKYKPKVEHSCLIVFTDGEFTRPEGGKNQMSIYKQLHLCRDLGVRVYVISVETVDQNVLRYTANTGGFSQIFKSFDEKIFEKAYEAIVQNEATNDVVIEKNTRRSLSKYFGTIALCCLGLASYLKLTVNRNFTEV